jgi:hypothetical protein
VDGMQGVRGRGPAVAEVGGPLGTLRIGYARSVRSGHQSFAVAARLLPEDPVIDS